MSVLTGAKQAIQIANAVTKASQGTSVSGNLKGRSVRHWSYYLLLTATAAGAAVAIAAAVMNMVPLMICSAVFLITNAVGAFYIRRFDRFNELEDYVSVMSNKIVQMSHYIQDLKKINQELGDASEDFEDNLQEDIEVWEHGYNKVKKEAEEIEKLTKRLEVTTKKLKTVETLYANLQNAVNTFSNHVGSLNECSDEFDDTVADLANQVTGAKEVLSHLDSENDEFDENNEIYERLNEANLAFLNHFQQEIEKIMNLQYGALEIKDTLEKEGKSLKDVNQKISHSIQTIADMGEKEQALSHENKNILDETEKLTKQLNALMEQLSKSRKQH